MNFVDGFNKLVSNLPAGLLTVLSIIGIILILCSIGQWIWSKRRSQGGISGFPWWMLILGALLCGPTITGPAILTVLQALVSIILRLFSWFAQLLGG
ncbi:MAG: hypothetical protein CMH36_08805 [Microbacterium sp.]|jgi:hypothetical protein|uniref:hypothetical protein n=1 Tax=Microbacterium sp. 4NA327F11 TaxID=2502229 RepID=UPI000C8E832D|nr:hypothetical protein [Microbacterium sp. 4NA327F11]MAL06910.1 hypothetical protein [Microbacterium sp.]MCK9913756.1 hypothetical protein [Microbacteriaceae bacterium K1510]|tara:strand:+ start:520 stop:810 length:291 start_codon:yes stop_codon:yes gene_type:complete